MPGREVRSSGSRLSRETARRHPPPPPAAARVCVAHCHIGPEKCASAAGNSKSPNLTKNGREIDAIHPFCATPAAPATSGAARSSWDRSRGSELNLFVLHIFLIKQIMVSPKRTCFSDEKPETNGKYRVFRPAGRPCRPGPMGPKGPPIGDDLWTMAARQYQFCLTEQKDRAQLCTAN